MILKLALAGIVGLVLAVLWLGHSLSVERTQRRQIEATLSIQEGQQRILRLAYENQATELDKSRRTLAAYKSEKRTVRVRLPDGTVFSTTESLIDLDERMEDWTKGKTVPVLPPEPPSLPWSPPWRPAPGAPERRLTVGAGVDVSGWSSLDPVASLGYQSSVLWAMVHGGRRTLGLSAGVRF